MPALTGLEILKGFQSFSPALTVLAGQARNGYAGFESKQFTNSERVESV
jgi:hypothetical protein